MPKVKIRGAMPLELGKGRPASGIGFTTLLCNTKRSSRHMRQKQSQEDLKVLPYRRPGQQQKLTHIIPSLCQGTFQASGRCC